MHGGRGMAAFFFFFLVFLSGRSNMPESWACVPRDFGERERRGGVRLGLDRRLYFV